MSPRWAVPVSLLPDELFSSWLTRAALAQGCDPLVLTGALWPRWRVWASDLDRGLSEERLSTLAGSSGIDVLKFEMASLRPIASAITSVSLEHLPIWPWVLALGSRNRKHHGGLQYCSCCFQEDKKPYYRKQWRLAWHTCCPTHGVLLLDRCSTCNAPLEPHRLSAEDGCLATCATCKSDLRKANPVALSRAVLSFQQAADEVLRAGQGLYGVEKLDTGGWFELSRYFVMLLRKAALMKNEGLLTFVKMLGVNADCLWSPATGLALELLPVEERARLIVGAWEMLDAEPECFLISATGAHLTKESLHYKNHQVPDLIATLIKTLPGKSISRTRKTQGNMDRPRTRQTVMRMVARLQRKR
ncbi:TPA: TniQ family protein [Aeromonas veronii]|nr:hypothetical protein [Aeromonas hydrophila]MBW5263929.1 hypothetical protein [Aeromonas hydrophila]MBW5278890.1 hypothetical protein [Aeromonas hydrophila]UJP34302.1 TniQ family protein [Aeromonas veronii]HEA3201574.1 TniQ family protein [Aeromonas veronii]